METPGCFRSHGLGVAIPALKLAIYSRLELTLLLSCLITYLPMECPYSKLESQNGEMFEVHGNLFLWKCTAAKGKGFSVAASKMPIYCDL